LASLLDDVHAILHLEVAEVLFADAALFPDPDDALLGEGATNLPERGSSARVGGDVEVDAPIGGASASDGVAHAGPSELRLCNPLRCQLDLRVRRGVVCGGIVVPLRLPVTHQNYSLW